MLWPALCDRRQGWRCRLLRRRRALQRRQRARKTTVSNTMVAESDSPVEASDMWHSVSSLRRTRSPKVRVKRPTLNAQWGWCPALLLGTKAHHKAMLHELD